MGSEFKADLNGAAELIKAIAGVAMEDRRIAETLHKVADADEATAAAATAKAKSGFEQVITPVLVRIKKAEATEAEARASEVSARAAALWHDLEVRQANDSLDLVHKIIGVYKVLNPEWQPTPQMFLTLVEELAVPTAALAKSVQCLRSITVEPIRDK